MKRVLSIMAITLSAIASVLIAQYAVRKFYNRWKGRRYTDSFQQHESYPWQ